MTLTMKSGSVILSAGLHPATLGDVHKKFVEQAPEMTRPQRDRIYRALSVHVELASRVVIDEPLTLWINGGFATHKSQDPKDVDIVYFTSAAGVQLLSHKSSAPLWTLNTVKAVLDQDRLVIDKLQPMGNLIDSYVSVDTPAMRQVWMRRWQSSRGLDSEPKGFVEVKINDHTK